MRGCSDVIQAGGPYSSVIFSITMSSNIFVFACAYCSLCSGMPHLSRREDTRLFGLNLGIGQELGQKWDAGMRQREFLSGNTVSTE